VPVIVNTNNVWNTGTYTVTVYVQFFSYTAASSQSFSLQLKHPCIVTTISTTQTIGPINFNFGGTTLLTPFTAFTDTEGACYGMPGLCPLTYTVSANTYGVTVVTGPAISVYTINQALKGTSTTITLTANSTP
jgi:hypothetical protein